MNVNTASICLGANTPDASVRLEAAFAFVDTLGTVSQSTPPYPTAPEYAGETEPYLNQIVILATELGLEDLCRRTKAYQTAVRDENEYAPLVNIDIDIVEWNDMVVRQADASASYYRTGLSMLKDI